MWDDVHAKDIQLLIATFPVKGFLDEVGILFNRTATGYEECCPFALKQECTL